MTLLQAIYSPARMDINNLKAGSEVPTNSLNFETIPKDWPESISIVNADLCSIKETHRSSNHAHGIYRAKSNSRCDNESRTPIEIVTINLALIRLEARRIFEIIRLFELEPASIFDVNNPNPNSESESNAGYVNVNLMRNKTLIGL